MYMKKTIILICGLPGSGKTTLAQTLESKLIGVGHVVCNLNADDIREFNDDWDFTMAGRVRQAIRMRELAAESSADFVITDFVAPLPQFRDIVSSDITVFMDTIDSGRFADTNSLFQRPEFSDIRVTTFNADEWANEIIMVLRSIQRT